MSFTQKDVILAFVDYTQRDLDNEDEHVSFTKRGGEQGYVNVFGPSHQPPNARLSRVVIEPDGSLSFKDEDIANAMGAAVRGEGVVFPGKGAAKWMLDAKTAATKFGSCPDLVRAVVEALRQHRNW